MDKILKHAEISAQLTEIYKAKNHDYGDSFGKMFVELGIITALTRIGDKFERLKTLAVNQNQEVKDESIKDTLSDMANYCIMTLIEMENNNK